ncbi:MAG: hypothetical protein IKJ41_03215 [Clostridia bacterium]|nr:hypothetical protein [Clostridia bacterium]
MRSNMFATVENKFKSATEDEIIEIALSSSSDVLSQMENFNDNTKFGTILVGTKLGVAGDGTINSKEKMLIDEVFGKIWNGPMEQIYDIVSEAIGDGDYDIVQNIVQLSNQIAIPFLHYILSFAYIDETFEDEVAEKLDNLFGMNLMVDFFMGDTEEVPAPKIKPAGLDAEIAQWFQDDNTLKGLNDIQAHFSHKSKTEVEEALDRLCEKGVLYKVDTLVGKMYGLA